MKLGSRGSQMVIIKPADQVQISAGVIRAIHINPIRMDKDRFKNHEDEG